MIKPAMTMVIPILFLFDFLGLFSAFLKDFDVVVKDGGNYGDHISLNNPGAYIFRPSHTYVDHTLKRQVPFPHAHHIFASALLEYTDQAFDAAIDSQYIANASRGRCEICKMIERVDERQG